MRPAPHLAARGENHSQPFGSVARKGYLAPYNHCTDTEEDSCLPAAYGLPAQVIGGRDRDLPVLAMGAAN